MAIITKKELDEKNKELTLENILMYWHIRDLYNKVRPDAIEKQDNVKGSLYRSNFACGGYIIIQDSNSENIEIHYLEDYYHYTRNLPYIDSLTPFKIVAERLYVARNKILFNKQEVI